MTTHAWLWILAAFGLAVVGTPLVRALARRAGVVAKVRSDRWHKKPTALIGGVAIFAATLLTCILAGIVTGDIVLFAGGGLMFAVGLIDDFLHIRPYQKLLGQMAAAGLWLAFGPLLPWTPVPILNYAFTFVWIIGITNAINLLDNMDGLASGVSLIAAAFLAAVLLPDQAAAAVAAAVLAAACAGFLVFNFNPASIFMGDSGALFIGYILAGLAIEKASALHDLPAYFVVPVLILFVPIFDTSFVTLVRKLNGRPASQGGRDHTSHRLVALGCSERQAVGVLYGLTIAGGALAYVCERVSTVGGLVAAVVFLGLTLLFGFRLERVPVYAAEKKNERP